MTTIFSDGFESGDFGAWDSVGSFSGASVSVASSAAAHGEAGARAAITGGASHGHIRFQKTLASPATELYGRFNFRIAGDATFMSMSLGGCGTALGYICDRTEVAIEKVGAQYRVRLRSRDDGGSWNSRATNPSPLFDLNTWHAIEFHWKAASAPGANNGQLQMWFDGVDVGGALTAMDNDTHTISVFGGFMYNINTAVMTLDFDDWEIADARVCPLRGYRVYHNAGIGPVDYGTVQGTVSEYADDWTSPALSYPASWRLGVRAFNEYGEEKNVNVVSDVVLLASGDESPARPNQPTGLAASPAEDGKVELAWDYDATAEAAACTHFHVYSDSGTGEVDYDTVVGTVEIDDGIFTHYAFLTGALSDGLAVRFAVQAATADDVEDTGTTWVETAADASAPDQPASLTGEVVR